MQAAVGERLRLIGISIPQCDVLTTLSEEEGVSQQELAKRLYVTKGNISGLLDRLESAG
ncbi:MAG TPA: MarR family transcriptional regulator, partial [Roseiarcus sp.]|nr:MarR family transcriptional regulator [Roseiarcus sp.]